MPVKILFTLPNFITAGSGRAMLNIVERLDRKRFAPAVCVARKGGDLDREVEAMGIPFVEAPFTVSPKPYVTLLLRAWRAAGAFRPHRYDLWHSFHYSDDYTEPIIARLAGTRAWVFTKKNMGWGSRAWRLRSSLASSIAVQNTAMVEQFFSRQAGKARHIPPGVDLQSFRPGPPDLALRQSWGFSPDTFLVGHVAQLVPIKNHPHLLRALALADGKIGLLFAGAELDSAYATKLRQLAVALGVNKRVRFCDKVQNVSTFLRSVDLFAFCSHKEACPVAALEAMACGLPSVVTAIPAMRDIHLNGETALVVPPDDLQAFASSIGSLMREPLRRKQLGLSARKRVEIGFTLNTEALRYQRFYNDVLGQSARFEDLELSQGKQARIPANHFS